MVIAVTKGCEGCLKLTGIAKVAYPEQLFPERSEEALNSAVSLALPYEGR
jgi:hypothetical protein